MSALEDLVYRYQSLPPIAQVGIPIGGVAAIGFIALRGNNPFSGQASNPTATITGPGIGDSNSGVAGTGDGGTGNSGSGTTPPISQGNPPTIPTCPAGQTYIPGIGCMLNTRPSPAPGSRIYPRPTNPPNIAPLPVAPVLTPGQRFPFIPVSPPVLVPIKPLPIVTARISPLVSDRPAIVVASPNPQVPANNYLPAQTAMARSAMTGASTGPSLGASAPVKSPIVNDYTGFVTSSSRYTPVVKAGASTSTVAPRPTTVTRALSRPVPV